MDDYPRFGHLLAFGGHVVGVLLQIFSRRETAAGDAVFCNLSSWCVDVEHRSYSIMLHMAAVKRKDVTYLNISPAPHTRKTIERLGFRRYSEGQMIASPLLSPPRSGVRMIDFVADSAEAVRLTASERQMLADHAAMGCLPLIGLKDGEAHPFLFQSRMFLRERIPCAHLIYCRDLDDFVAFAHAIGRRLAKRRQLFCFIDAKARVSGLVGGYFADRRPRYYQGPTSPRLGDLAYTEVVLFGP